MEFQVQNTQSHVNKHRQLRQSVQIRVISNNVEQGYSIEQVKSNKEICQCRICLQNSAQSDLNFIRPCDCTGSLTYVHQACFTQWLGKLLKKKTNQQLKKTVKDGMECQLCKMKFPVRIHFQRMITNCSQLKQKISLNKFQFITLAIINILSIILLGILSSLMPKDSFNISLNQQSSPASNKQPSQNQTWQKIVLVTSLFSLIAITCLTFYLIISQYMVMYQMEFAYKGKQIKTLKGIVQEE